MWASQILRTCETGYFKRRQSNLPEASIQRTAFLTTPREAVAIDGFRVVVLQVMGLTN